MHGAGTPKKDKLGGRPIETGQYSRYRKLLPERLISLLPEHEANSTLLDLLPRIELLDAHLLDLVQHLGEEDVCARCGLAKKKYDELVTILSNQALREELRKVKGNQAVQQLGEILAGADLEKLLWFDIRSLSQEIGKLVEQESKRMERAKRIFTIDEFKATLIGLLKILWEELSDEPDTYTNIIRRFEGDVLGRDFADGLVADTESE